MDTSTSIETPEHVDFQFRLAGPTRRAAAWLLDSAIRGVFLLMLAIGLAIMGMAGSVEDAGVGALLVVAFFLEWGYFVVCEMLMDGRTPGKKALKLRVVREDGTTIQFADSVMRNLLRAADSLPSFYAIGALVSGLDTKFRRLGDLAAGTIVIVEERSRLPVNRHRPPEPSSDELEPFPSLVMLQPDELAALELFVSRARALHPVRADDLANIVAPGFARRLGMSPPKHPARFLVMLHH
ncbi:MAG: putative RDD family membrane protein YckC, partial [Myxococcota bacterium]